MNNSFKGRAFLTKFTFMIIFLTTSREYKFWQNLALRNNIRKQTPFF